MEILTVEQVEEKTGWSQRTIWGKYRTGKVQAQQIGRNWVTTQAALNAHDSGRAYTMKTLYGVKSAAEYKGVEPWRIRRLVDSKILKAAATIGNKGGHGTMLFTQRQLDALTEEQFHRTGGTQADTTYDDHIELIEGMYVVQGTRNRSGNAFSSKHMKSARAAARIAYSQDPVYLMGITVTAKFGGGRQGTDMAGAVRRAECVLMEDVRKGSTSALVKEVGTDVLAVLTLKRLSFT